MKNLHVLPTHKPSRLHFDDKLFLSTIPQISKDINSIVEGRNIYITSDEEIKEGDRFLDTVSNTTHKAELATGIFNTRKKIILTTDQDLIKDGVQPIDDEFLEWFVKNPSCEEVEIENGWGLEIDIETPYHKIIIPQEENIYDVYLKEELKKYKNIKTIVFNKPEEPKQETLPTKWFKTEEIETWIGDSDEGGRGKLIVLHQCGENKEELISQLKTLIDGLKDGFEYFAQ